MRASLVVSLLPLLALTVSCNNTSSAATSPSTPTLVALDPQDFLGAVPCSNAPGAMQRYVATVYDVTPGISGDAGAFALPSSGPVSCTRQIAFGGGFVVAGHRYVADIQGYDRSDIKPFGSGSPIMVDGKTGAVIAPRWTTSCGRAASAIDGGTAGDAGGDAAPEAGAPDATAEAGTVDGGDAGTDAATSEAGSTTDEGHPVVSAANTTVFVRHCAPLTAQQPPSSTGISVGIDDAMLAPLSLQCANQAGQVDRYRVSIDGSTTAPLEAACGQRVTFQSLTPGNGYHFTLEAFKAGATKASWATHCFRTALDGAIAPAACDPLTDQGAIELDSSALLAQLGMSCGSNLIALSAELASNPTPQSAIQTPPECDAPIHFGGLSAGLYGIDVTTTLTTGPGPTANCVASVTPANTTLALCTPNP